MAQGGDFKGRQFTAEVILWAVRWYLMFPISYRDLELMLQDRKVEVDHTTLFRWIQAYAPELEKRVRPHLHRSNGSWRVDETSYEDRCVKSVLLSSHSRGAPGWMKRLWWCGRQRDWFCLGVSEPVTEFDRRPFEHPLLSPGTVAGQLRSASVLEHVR